MIGAGTAQRLGRVRVGLVRRLSAAKSRLRGAFVRPDERYPDFYYRYSYDIANVFGLRIFGVYAKAGRVKIRWWLATINLLVIIAPIPLGVLAGHLDKSQPEEWMVSVLWISYFSFLAVVVQIFSLAGVHVFHGLTPELEKCLTSLGMRRYERWASISTALIPQLLFAILLSLGGCLCLFLVSREPALATALHITWASYVSVAVSVVYLSGGVWWMFAGAILSTRLVGDGCMRLFPYAPAMTPGVELLVRCYRLAFVGGCAGVLLCLTPILTWVRTVPDSPYAVSSALGLSALSFLALVVIAIVPDWFLSKAILRERHRLMSAINGHLPQRPQAVRSLTDREAYLLAWMQTMASGPRGTINESVIVTLVAALLSASIPVVISFLLTAS